MTTTSSELSHRPKVVIIGAGFGGIMAAKKLARVPVDVTVIDRQNYHLFQPLLYQVATAGLSPGEIAWPIRRMLRHQQNTKVVLGEVTGIDPLTQTVSIGQLGHTYDYLIIATGSRHAYFGHDDWERYAPGLKGLDDATEIRKRILLAFEQAEMAADPAVRKRLLTFVIVGGGSTGVELAGAIAELARKTLETDFRTIDPGNARILLVEAGARLLSAFPETLGDFARYSLQALGVEVMLGNAVTACNAEGINVGNERIPTATVLWAAGVAASPAAKWLNVEHDRAGRVVVNPDLSAPGLPNVFVIGDTALVRDDKGEPVPGIAPAAKQMGAYVVKVINHRIAHKPALPPFRYHHWLSLATIGRRSAVIDFGFMQLKGWLAWWIWGIAHIYFLIGMRNRIIVAIQWLWSYIAFDRGARLITGAKPE